MAGPKWDSLIEYNRDVLLETARWHKWSPGLTMEHVKTELASFENTDKCGAKSERFRLAGKEEATKKSYARAIEFYTKSIACGPVKSEVLAMSLYERSDLLCDLKMYPFAIHDIKYACSNGFPESEKLLLRLAYCQSIVLLEPKLELHDTLKKILKISKKFKTEVEIINYLSKKLTKFDIDALYLMKEKSKAAAAAKPAPPPPGPTSRAKPGATLGATSRVKFGGTSRAPPSAALGAAPRGTPRGMNRGAHVSKPGGK